MIVRTPIQGRLSEKQAILLADATQRREWEVFLYAVRQMPKYWRIYLALFSLSLALLFVAAVTPWVARIAVDQMLPNRDWSLFPMLLGVTILLAVIQWVTDWVKGVLSAVYGQRINVDMRHRYFRHLRKLSWLFLQRRPVGEHIYRAISDCDGTSAIVFNTIPNFLSLVVSFALILAFTLYIDPTVGIAVIVFAVPYGLTLYQFTTIQKDISKQEAAQGQKVVAGLQEGIAGVKTIKLYGRSRHEVRRYLGLLTASQLLGFKNGMVGIGKDIAVNTIMLYGFRTGLYIYFAWRVIHGELSYGTLLVLADYSERLLGPIRDGVDLFNDTRMKLVPVERFMQTMYVEPLEKSVEFKDSPPIQGGVSFENVTFSYSDDRACLEGVSFEVRKGTTTAIVGMSGAGKSTIAGLLLGLYTPDQGRILFDSRDSLEFDPISLQKQIGVVMQETDVFEGSIADNLRLVNPHVDDQSILSLLREVELDEWVKGLPNGIYTDLREGGSLSIGQRQRLGIARALLNSPRLMVLDEPTSSLDARTETAILDLIKRVTDNRTKIVITHRLGTIVDAEQIIVLEKGKLVQRGTHAELIATEGIYRNMVESSRPLSFSASDASE